MSSFPRRFGSEGPGAAVATKRQSEFFLILHASRRQKNLTWLLLDGSENKLKHRIACLGKRSASSAHDSSDKLLFERASRRWLEVSEEESYLSKGIQEGKLLEFLPL